MKIGINCGHTLSKTIGSGAIGYLNESDETRAVGYALMEKLKARGVEVVDCTDDFSPSVSENLRSICRIANLWDLDMFISVHFNSGGGRGCEAFTYNGTDKAKASAMLKALCGAGFKNRGVKNGDNLYVLRNTKAPACLLEICFVDSREDARKYNDLGAETVADILCRAIMNEDFNESEDLTMSQYEKLKKEISNLTETVKLLTDKTANLTNHMIYNYIDDNMPKWARESVQWAVDNDILIGDENGLNLDDKDLRYIVMMHRMNGGEK